MKNKLAKLGKQAKRLSKIKGSLLIFFVSIMLCHQKSEAQITAAQQQKIDSIFSQWNSNSTPGMELLILRKGKIILDHPYGMADLINKTSNKSSRKMWVASMSKQFTALAIALLTDQKKISLQDDIRKYLPELPFLGDTIRISQLVYHTSGLREGFTLTAMSFKSEEEYTNANVLNYLSKQTGSNFRPGERFEYNNGGYVLLALIVERVSKMDFPGFVKQFIFKPLGMNESRFVTAFPYGDTTVATGYAVSNENNRRSYQPAYFKGQTYGSSGLVTTANDLAKWDRVFYEPVFGKRVQQLQLQTGRLNKGQSIPYAFGLELEPYKHKKAITHSGVDAGYKAEILRFPAEEFTVICLANTDDAYGLTNKLFNIAELFIPFDRRTAPVITAICQPRAGAYIDPATSARMKFVQVKDVAGIADSENGYYASLEPAGDCNFKVKDILTDKYQFNGDKLQYTTRAETVSYHSIKAATPGAGELKAAAGAWYSAELDATYNFFEKDGILYLKFFDAYDVPLSPFDGNLYAGDFLGTNIIHFVKSNAGDITAMEFNRDGIHNLAFKRR